MSSKTVPLEKAAELFSKVMREKQVQTENIGANCKALSLADHLSLGKNGWFHVATVEGRLIITVRRPRMLKEVTERYQAGCGDERVKAAGVEKFGHDF